MLQLLVQNADQLLHPIADHHHHQPSTFNQRAIDTTSPIGRLHSQSSNINPLRKPSIPIPHKTKLKTNTRKSEHLAGRNIKRKTYPKLLKPTTILTTNRCDSSGSRNAAQLLHVDTHAKSKDFSIDFLLKSNNNHRSTP